MSRQCTDGATTLPRDFRFHHSEPKTPEPSNTELRQPSPPRQRLKIKKRHASSLLAPTEQFLASVAAADMPIPTIEIPAFEDSMMEDNRTPMSAEGYLAPEQFDGRTISPPRTPMPESTAEECARPDWSMRSPSPVEERFRSTSVLSNRSDLSDDSFFSGDQFSRRSDNGSCTSPESEADDPFQFPDVKGKGKIVLDNPFNTKLNGKLWSKTRSDAPWTKAQNDHLWATYIMYLQDPTVTPFRFGASLIPPEGVCYRVARESKRSWKGPKNASRLAHLQINSSMTPTPGLPKVYGPWPHSGCATRNHLRDMCKSKNISATHRHLQSRSPTPFSKPNPRNRRRTPEAFSVKDMSLVLTTSTALSMQPDGPLAQLTAGDAEIEATMESQVTKTEFPALESFQPLSFGLDRVRLENGVRLGSPFVARTYGPSSSRPLRHYSRSSNSISHDGGHQLGSPFDHSRSLNGTQKRRAQHELDEELSPNGAIVRPSILNEQLFGTPLKNRRVRSRGFSLGDEAFRRVPGIFQAPPVFQFPRSEALAPPPVPTATVSAPMLLPPPRFDPPRLGSPFSEAKTFPRRVFPEGTATIRRSQFATMHQSRRSIESFDFGPGPSLQSRLQNLENKLNKIQENRTNESPDHEMTRQSSE